MSLSAEHLRRHIKKAARVISPATLSRHLQSRKVIQDFADNHALVYFGYVNYKTDEHRLVRGMTTATNQDDSHYCIGSYDGYDVVFVRRRSESSKFVSGHATQRNWLIMQIDLRTSFDIPHVFIGPHKGKNAQYDELTTALHSFQPIQLGVFGAHDKAFTDKYTIFTKPSRNVDTERLLTPTITTQIGQYFYPLAVEIWDGCVFIYSTQRHPNAQLLDIMIKNGVWLAAQIDIRCKQLQDERAYLARPENA